uniref:HMG box domain-containing protein n=1 Tax=Anopheles culicifacies TaxID=139723 RepID=A0A182MSN5_9DIPT
MLHTVQIQPEDDCASQSPSGTDGASHRKERSIEPLDNGDVTEITDSISTENKLSRPQNAFFLFCMKHRKVVSTEFNDKENRAIISMLGKWWKRLPVEQQRPYIELAKEPKEEKSSHQQYQTTRQPVGQSSRLNVIQA